jgi:UDP-GlcNAc:undecaprenyl-phosphate GlcNAc-1-phosphate transferase
LGFDHHEAVMVIYAIQADLLLLAYWLRFESDLVILGAVSVFFVTAIGLLHLAARYRWRMRSIAGEATESPLARLLTRLRRPDCVPRWSYFAIAIAVWAYASLVAADTVELSGDVRLLLLVLLAITLIWLAVLRAKPLSTIEKAALYITAAVLVYLDSVVVDAPPVVNMIGWAAILTMAAGTLVRLRLSPDRRFELTPLDLIVLFVALVIPSLPDTLGLPHGGALGIAKLVIFFYAIEALVSRVEMRVLWLRLAASAVLAGLVVHNLL